MPDPFAVDPGNAVAALTLAWGDAGYKVIFSDGRYQARHEDSGSVITGDTPDALNLEIRADWAARNPGG